MSEEPSGDSVDTVKQVRPGWLERSGGRVCLLDLPTCWEALHRAFFDEVGVGAGNFLYQAGLRTAASWVAKLPRLEPIEVLKAGLEQLSRRGFGTFRVVQSDIDADRITIVADDSVEAWSHRQRHGRSERAKCSFTSGVLAGLWCMAASRVTATCGTVCWETTCAATDAPQCRFELGSPELLTSLGLTDPLEGRTVRWELQSLTGDLHLSHERLTTLERKLAERESAYQNLLDHMNDVLVVLDRNKRVIFYNRQFLESTALSPAEAIGSSPKDRIVAEDWQRVEQIYDDLIAGKRASATYVFRAVRPQGVLHFESSARAIRDSRGDVAIEILSRDVTLREQACEELAAANDALRRKQKATDDDLRMAKRVHESLLPRPVSNQWLDIDVKYIPAGRVGGDYCQFAFPTPSRCFVAVCDVSGHGMAAALLASHVDSHVRNVLPGNPRPIELVQGINEFLLTHFGSTGLFVTFFALEIDLETLEVEYCGAGHPGPILQRRKRNVLETLASQNLPVGIMEDFVRGKGASRTRLDPTDRLIIYTDGLTETRDPHGNLFTAAGLAKIVREAINIPLFDLGRFILERVEQFRGDHPHHDDISLVLIEAHARARVESDRRQPMATSGVS
jgi:PAS domain S-box-containing protein